MIEAFLAGAIDHGSLASASPTMTDHMEHTTKEWPSAGFTWLAKVRESLQFH
jgi:hypothetical protein